MHRIVACVLAIVIVTAANSVALSEGYGAMIGISKTKPAKGPAVKTDKGYMIPYTLKMPNSTVEFEMVPVPGGTFTMNVVAKDGKSAEVEVVVEPSWMGKYEVTWVQYKEFMNLYAILKEFEARKMRPVTDANKIDAITTPTELYDPSMTFVYGEEDQQPAVTMTQYAAKQYTKWLTGVYGHQYRLPCAAEWEHAARGGAQTKFHFGDDPKKLKEYGWFADNADDAMQKVGEKKPNQFGLYDMHGNVSEWVLDKYVADGERQLPKGKKLKALETVVWPDKPFGRAACGGSFYDDAEDCTVASRVGSHSDWKNEDPNEPKSPWWFTDEPAHGVGFRLFRPLNELPKEKMAKYWEADCALDKMYVENRLIEGRGILGLTDKDLPAAMKKITN